MADTKTTIYSIKRSGLRGLFGRELARFAESERGTRVLLSIYADREDFEPVFCEYDRECSKKTEITEYAFI